MTKSGEFIKVNISQGVDIGSEIEFSRGVNFLSLFTGIILKFFPRERPKKCAKQKIKKYCVGAE